MPFHVLIDIVSPHYCAFVHDIGYDNGAISRAISLLFAITC